MRSPSFLLSKHFLNAICRSQPRKGCKCIWDSLVLNRIISCTFTSMYWNIHESPWLMIPIPAAFVCPEACDTMAEDTCNIASHLSIDCTHDKRGILRQARNIQAVLKQTFQRTSRTFSHPSRASCQPTCLSVK